MRWKDIVKIQKLMLNLKYSIGDLELISGIRASTLRMWESRYNFLKPLRTQSNNRVYSQQDLICLLKISELLKANYKICYLSKLNIGEIDKLYEDFSLVSTSLNIYLSEFLSLFVEKDIQGIEILFDKLFEKLVNEDFIILVLEPLLLKIKLHKEIKSFETYYIDYVLNRLTLKILYTAETLRQNHRNTKEILIIQSDTSELPCNLALVYFLAAAKHYKIHFYFNKLSLPSLKKMKGAIQPDIVYTEFNENLSDAKLVEYFEVLEDSFPMAKNIVGGSRLREGWKLINNKVYCIRGIEVLAKAL